MMPWRLVDAERNRIWPLPFPSGLILLSIGEAFQPLGGGKSILPYLLPLPMKLGHELFAPAGYSGSESWMHFSLLGGVA